MKNIVIIGCGSGIGLATAKQLQNEVQIIRISRTETPELNNIKLHFYQKDILTDSLDDVSFPEKIDGLVYAPGSINLKPFGRLSEEDFKKDFEINVLGAIKIIQKLLPNLKKSESASVVLFSTVATKLGMPFHSSIAASKSAVAPSLSDTNLATALLASPEKREAAAKRHPLQKIGNPEEIAKMVVFLLSDSSSWIT